MAGLFMKQYWAYRKDGGTLSMCAWSQCVKESIEPDTEEAKHPFRKLPKVI